jgi:hypothetical protein
MASLSGAAVSAAEQAYIVAGVQQGCRSDGRGRLDYRWAPHLRPPGATRRRPCALPYSGLPLQGEPGPVRVTPRWPPTRGCVRGTSVAAAVCRHVAVECGLLPHVNGSARVTLVGGGGGTEVLASVKAELGPPSAGKGEHGTLECSVDLWSAAAHWAVGRGAQNANLQLSSTLNRCVASLACRSRAGLETEVSAREGVALYSTRRIAAPR